MTPAALKNLLSILLIGTGALHLLVAAFGAPEAIRLPVGVFGIIYAALGFWVRGASKLSVFATLFLTVTGLGLGGSNYLQNGGPVTLPIMFVIDVAVLIVGALWLLKWGKSG